MHDAEINDLKEELKQSLLIQDQLYEQHFKIVRIKDDEINKLRSSTTQLTENYNFLEQQFKILEDFRHTIES